MASASGTSTGRRRRLYRASVSPQAGARASAASEVSTNMSLAGGLYLGSRRWLADRRTWAAVVFMCCVVGVGCWLSIEQDRLLLVADRSNVQRLADSYALNLAEQLRAAVGTTLAVGALAKVEGDSLSEAHFILLATRLLRFYPGIGELQFSPYGVIKFSHSYSGKATAPGLSLFHQNLLAPGSRATIRAYPDRLATTPGPQELVDGDLAVIIRHPIFTTVAPRTLPLNETYVDPLGRGADAELGCATEEEAEANCYFSGPDEDGQTGTHFYAFATALARMDRLFEPVGLKSLHIDHGYEWQLKVLENWHPSINETQGVFATSPYSPANVTLLDPVVVNITVSEIGVHWVFSVSPQGGWAARRDGSFTIQLVLVAVFTVIGGMGMGCATVASVRANYKERVLASEQHAALTLDARAAELAKVARSRLIRTVMHDLRSPLLSIANLSRSLRAAPGSTQISELGKLPDYMLSCSSIMESIVSDMLDFERIEAGQISLTFAPLRVHELVNGAMAIFLARPTQAHDRPFARAHLIGIATLKGIQLDAPAPEGLAASTVLLADGLRLQQCMQNGLSNAIKFTEQGKSVRLRTAVELNKDRPGWAQLTVS
ncbi:hypothetical protein T492DRAFT_842599, partial [Pavlovales sp. CCMP2436]